MLTKIIYASLLALISPSVSAAYHGPIPNRHAEIAKRADGDVQLFKRIAGARWTYYDVEETGNAGSCGKKHVNADFTVAMNAAQMNSAWCFKTITMTQGGKTTTATISDTCPGCPYGGLDLTEGLFGFFLGHWPQGGGVLAGDWEFTDAAPAKPVVPAPAITTKPAAVAPVTPAKPVPVTSVVVSSKPISSSTISGSTSSSISTSSKAASSNSASSTRVSSSANAATASVDYLSGVASGLAIPTGSIDRTGLSPSNLQDMNSFFVQVGGIVMAAGSI